MSYSAVGSKRVRVLADVLPASFVNTIALVVSFAVLNGLAAQVSIPLPFTPVPLTLQTFAVLVTAAGLGASRAALSMALYVVVGIAGVPWFAGGGSGWGGASFGYVLGFLAGALVAGALSDRGYSRSLTKMILMFGIGSAVIYLLGVTWLIESLHVSVGQGLHLGLWPFLPGDLVKAVVAAVSVPAVWKVLRRVGESVPGDK